MGYSIDFYNYETGSGIMRALLGVDRLKPEQAQQVRNAVELHKQRQENKQADIAISNYAHVRSEIIDLIELEIKSILKRCYRKPASSWAGGNTYVDLKIGSKRFASNSIREWSSNGKWSGQSASHTIGIMRCWRQKVLGVPGLVDAGGMLTTHAVEIEPGLYEATWIEQSKGLTLKQVDGCILKQGSEFYHGKSPAACRRVAKTREKAKAAEKALQRQIEAMSAVPALIEQYGDLQVRRSDSLKAGNCEAGTDNWIARHFPDRKSVTIREILDVDQSSMVVRVCRAAVVRAKRMPKKILAEVA